MRNRSTVIKILSLAALLIASGFLYSCDDKPATQAPPAADTQQAPQQVPAGQAGTTVNVNVAATAGQQMPADQTIPAAELIPEGDPTPPPPLPAREPELVVVPSGEAQVYMVPNTVGVYFYGGYWYRYHHGVWFRALNYYEPWVVIRPAYVPRFVIGIPPAYPLYLPGHYHRIHYCEFHSNWRTWDRERHWHRESWFQNERRAEIRRDRIRLANERLKSDRRIRTEKIRTIKGSTFKGANTLKGGLTGKTQKQLQMEKRDLHKQKTMDKKIEKKQIKGSTFKGSKTIKGTTFKGGNTIKSNVTVKKNIQNKNIVNKNAQKNPPRKLDNKPKDIHNR